MAPCSSSIGRMWLMGLGAVALGLAGGCMSSRRADATPAAEARCFDCHGDAKNGNAGPPPASWNEAAKPDAHQSHLAASGWRATVSCDACHKVPTTLYERGHIDSPLPAELTWGTPATEDGAVPVFDGTRCSNVYCHGATLHDDGGFQTEPTWTAVGQGEGACGACHGVPPAGAHVQRQDCATCHGMVIGSAGNFVAPELHINGTVDVRSDLQCNSCHGDAGADPSQPINWAPPDDTSGNSVASARGVGAHRRHLTASTWRAPIACEMCHKVPPTLDAPGHNDSPLPAELSWSTPANADDASPVFDGTRCNDVYCHGATYPYGGGFETAPRWTAGQGEAACGACHGLPPGGHLGRKDCATCHGMVVDSAGDFVAPELHVNGKVDVKQDLQCTACHGGEATPTSGSHGKHIAERGYGCPVCHFDYPAQPTHRNGVLDTAAGGASVIRFSGPLTTGGSYDPQARSCTGIYCHGTFVGGNGATRGPTWGGAANCTTSQCHGAGASGNPAGSASPDIRHGTHLTVIMALIDPSTGAPYTEEASCGVCHDGLGEGTATHIDAKVDVAFNYANPEGARGEVTSGGEFQFDLRQFAPVVCANTYCHGNFTGGAIDTVSWAESKSDAGWCGTCHTTNPTSVKHAAHLTRYPGACTYCHDGYSPTSAPATHVSLHKDVVFGYSHPENTAGPPSYVEATKTCAKVYCHGNFPSVTYDGVAINPGNSQEPLWHEAATVACGDCHGDSANNYSSPTHGKHTVATRDFRTQRYFGDDSHIESCDACHSYGADTVRTFGFGSTQGSYGTTYHANISIDADGVDADVSFKADNTDLASRTTPQTLVEAHTSWNGATTSCSNSWCHGNFTNGVDAVGENATPNWRDPASAACGTCHDTGFHANYGCGGNCHPLGDPTPQVFSEHVNGTIGF